DDAHARNGKVHRGDEGRGLGRPPRRRHHYPPAAEPLEPLPGARRERRAGVEQDVELGEERGAQPGVALQPIDEHVEAARHVEGRAGPLPLGGDDDLYVGEVGDGVDGGSVDRPQTRAHDREHDEQDHERVLAGEGDEFVDHCFIPGIPGSPGMAAPASGPIGIVWPPPMSMPGMPIDVDFIAAPPMSMPGMPIDIDFIAASRLVSESTRNCADVTTRSPSWRPPRTSYASAAAAPTCT